MIDLRFPELPSYIECDGSFFSIDTSFRTWITFGDYLKKRKLFYGIFINEVPFGNWVESALEFYESKNVCPHDITTSHSAEAIDYVLDGEYIVSAFQQAYGIDLTTEDMHWHRFKALLIGLPESTMLKKIISYRTWVKPSSRHDENAEMAKLRSQWSLPDEDEDEKRAAVLEWADKVFS